MSRVWTAVWNLCMVIDSGLWANLASIYSYSYEYFTPIEEHVLDTNAGI
jgi:hypothetical protein